MDIEQMTRAARSDRGVLMTHARALAMGCACWLAAGCGSVDRIEPDAVARADGQTADAGSVVMRGEWVYPPGPRRMAMVRTPAGSDEGGGVRYDRIVTETDAGGRFEIVVRAAGDSADLGDDSGLIRRVWLRRTADGSVVMERVQDSEHEGTAGPPWRAFVYDPPLLLMPAELRAGEVIESESALSERAVEEPGRELHRGVIGRRLWAPGAGDPSLAVAREIAPGLVASAEAGDGMLLLETLRVKHRGAVMRREHVWVIGTDGSGVVGSAERFRLSVFRMPVQSGASVERRVD